MNKDVPPIGGIDKDLPPIGVIELNGDNKGVINKVTKRYGEKKFVVLGGILTNYMHAKLKSKLSQMTMYAYQE